MVHVFKDSSHIEQTRETLQGQEGGSPRPRRRDIQKDVYMRKVSLRRPYMLVMKATLTQ
jgi:hypothetical protein